MVRESVKGIIAFVIGFMVIPRLSVKISVFTIRFLGIPESLAVPYQLLIAVVMIALSYFIHRWAGFGGIAGSVYGWFSGSVF